MSITYGGQPLLLETPELEDWLDRYGGTDELKHLCPPFDAPPRVNYAEGDSTNYYKPRINRLYWPTGAQRWSLFYGLADTPTKDAIVKATQEATPQGSEILELSDGTTTIKPRMYLLPPRPLSCRADSKDKGVLWLIPLVDERYWWQFRHTGELELTGSADWSGLYSQIAAQLGITITVDTVDADYLKPDPDSVNRKFGNVPALLDAVAHSVGQRIVRRIGTYDQKKGPKGNDADSTRAINWTNSQTDLTNNLSESHTGKWTLAAGDQFDSEPYSAAENVLVAFRKSVDGRTYPEEFKTYEKSPAAADFPANRLVDDTVKWVHSTALSDQSTNGLGGTPDNDATLDALAAQIATDYYEGHEKRYDYNFNGIKIWQLQSYDDYVEWSAGSLFTGEQGGGYKAATRAVSVQPNFGVEFMLHADSDNVTDDGGPCCYAIYEAGTTTYDDSPQVTVDFDTERFAVPWAELTSSGMKIYGSGVGRINYVVDAERVSGSSSATSDVFLRRTPDGGAIADVAGARVGLSHAATGTGQESGGRPDPMVTVSPGDLYTVEIVRSSGSSAMTTVAEGSGMRFCPCKGFQFRDSLFDVIGAWIMETPGSFGAAAGERADISDNALHLTENGTITDTPGVIGTGAKLLTDASSFLSRADHALISGGQTFSFCGWVKFDAVGVFQNFARKDDDYDFTLDSSDSNIVWGVDLTTGGSSIKASTFGALSADTWYWVYGEWDETAKVAKVSVNNTGAGADKLDVGLTESFGGRDDVNALQFGWTFAGSLDEWYRFNRKLSLPERTYLYNGGQGRRPKGL